jgi:hypothetical protein
VFTNDARDSEHSASHTESVSDWTKIRRGAIVAFVPFFLFFAITWNFFATAVLSVPFLALGVRIEGDGDWSSPRRRATLFVVSVIMALVAATFGNLAGLGFVIAPVVGIVVWLAAGRADAPSNPSVVVRVRRRSSG